jgi:peptide/nickel transport system substrate-binding protein
MTPRLLPEPVHCALWPAKTPRAIPALIAAMAAAVLALAACSGPAASSAGSAARRSGNTLTVGYTLAPTTLNPGTAQQNDALFEELAYEPLIVHNSNGSLAPGLALSWRYVGTGNKTFVLRLRPHVRFAHGGTLTAQDVVADLQYVVKSGGQDAPFLAGDRFTATGPLTVTITAPKPNPDLAVILTQDYVIGDIISENGLRSPKSLGTQTFGAGPYELDPAATVTGERYTYVRNPDYYDPSAVHWKKIVIEVISTPQSMLNALETGQIQVASGDASTVSAARRAGLTVSGTPALWVGAILADREGSISKPLADVRVRQALNYATNRALIARGLFPSGVAAASDQPAVPGGYAYDPGATAAYGYDPGKARQLLAAAGYAHGFTLRIVTAEYDSMNLVCEALSSEWKKIGVSLQVTDYANASQYDSAAFSAKFPAFMTVDGTFVPMGVEAPALFLPQALYNPFHTAAPALESLYARDASSSGATETTADQRIEAYLVQQAWFVPVVTIDLSYYATKAVTGTAISPKAPLLDLYDVRPG